MLVKNRPEQDCSIGGNDSITSVDVVGTTNTGKKIHHNHRYRRHYHPGSCFRLLAVATTVCCVFVLEYQSILQSLFVLNNNKIERSTLTNEKDNHHPTAAGVEPNSINILRMMQSASSSQLFNTKRVGVKQQVQEQPSHHPKEEETRKQNTININNKSNNNNEKKHKMTMNEQPPSMVRYHACCGLGHRLQRMAAAHYAAKARFHFGLTGIWGKCHKTDLFSYLFEPEEEDAATAATNNSTYPRGTLVNIHNEVAGFTMISPPKVWSPGCPCPDDQIQLDYQFYQSLRNRFRFRDKVEQFRRDHGFDQHTVIGIHIRAGNGEQDFLRRHRGIRDPESFRRNIIAQLQEKIPTIMSNNGTGTAKAPLVYVASDTLSMIQQLRNEIHNVTSSSNTKTIVPTNATTATKTLRNDIPVVDYPHVRIGEGEGVILNNNKKNNNTNSSAEESCLSGWRDALIDMMLLSSADVVVATSYSSFSQSMPLSIAMQESSFITPFCELTTTASTMTVLDPQAPPPQQELHCFRTYQEWCLESKSKKTGKVPNKDYWDLPDSVYKIQTVQQ